MLIKTKSTGLAQKLPEAARDKWALVNQQTSLQHTAASVESRLAELSLELRWQEGHSLQAWGDNALVQIQRHFPELKLLQASLFAQVDGQYTPVLQQIGGLAVATEAVQKLGLGEGLVGQAAKDKRSFRFEVAENGFSPTTAFFKVQGRSVHVIPLVYNTHCVGVWEFVSLHGVEKMPGTTLAKITTTLGGQLAGFLSQARITSLLEDSRRKNSELERQEIALRTKIEELSSIQDKLQGAHVQLEAANENLESKVAERTKELEFAMVNLKDAQSQLIVAEKMASLGQLIAGVAHEINTPIGAVKAASTNIMDLLPSILHNASHLVPTLAPEHRALATTMVSYFLTQGKILSAKEERVLKRGFAKTLEEAGIEEAAYVSDLLVAAGFYDDPLPYAPLFQHAHGRELLDYVVSQGQMIRNLRNIQLAANKTSKVVFALKNFTHTHENNQFVQVDLKENIEMVLILYHNQLKRGIEVYTEYDDVPGIMGNPDELSQVWTNIVQNAAQAMDQSGKLSVSLKNLGDKAQISITDSGKGIPADKLEKIFEPFYTTKRRGEGTGLGLDICRKIVEKHHGRIYVESRPGRTTFFIEIPYPQTN